MAALAADAAREGGHGEGEGAEEKVSKARKRKLAKQQRKRSAACLVLVTLTTRQVSSTLVVAVTWKVMAMAMEGRKVLVTEARA